MIKIPKPARLPQAIFFLLLIAIVSHFSACGPAGEGGTTSINPDSVKNHILPIGLAVQYTANFRAELDTFNRKLPHFTDSMQFGNAEAFNSDVIRDLLNQSNDKQGKAVGIRIYYGRDNTGMVRMILVPYDSKGNDIINHMMDLNGKPVQGVSPTHVEALTVTGDGQTMQDGIRCPTVCDDGSSGLK